MGGLLHLVQRGGAWAGWGPAQSPPRCTKCNSPPINGQYTNFILFDVALWLPLGSKGLTEKLNLWNKRCFYRNSAQCQKLEQNIWSAIFRPWHGHTVVLLYLFVDLSIQRCSKSAQKFAVRVCQVATVVTETTQLVLSQLKKLLSH